MQISIAGQSWDFWDDAEIHLGLDTHWSVGFGSPFDALRRDFRDAFRPFSFIPATVDIGSDRLITGKIFDVKPKLDAKQSVCDVSVFSLPAELDFSDPLAGMLPLEAKGLTLQQVALQLSRHFGFAVVSDDIENKPFTRIKARQKRVDTRAQQSEKLGPWLAELAKQRDMLVTSTATGALHLLKVAKPGLPVATLVEGEQPLLGVEVDFDPANYFNEITGFTTGKKGSEISKYTERVQRLGGGAVRALNFKLDAVEKGDAANAVRSKIGRMVANLATYTVHVPTLRDPLGRLWQPNTTIKLKAPSAMVYSEYEFLIRDVYLKSSAGETTASLGLVLPGSFSGDIPATLPWDEAA